MADDYLEALEVLVREGWAFWIDAEGHRIKLIGLNGQLTHTTFGDTLHEAILDMIKDGGP